MTHEITHEITHKMSCETTQHEFAVNERHGNVQALLRLPPHAKALYVMAHGAGADMRHSFMESVSTALGARRIATLRYNPKKYLPTFTYTTSNAELVCPLVLRPQAAFSSCYCVFALL